MKLLVIFVTILAIIHIVQPLQSLEDFFEEYKQQFSKIYLDEDVNQFRLEAFRKNLLKIKELQDSEHGTAKYGLTKFSDWSDEEFHRLRGFIRPQSSNQQAPVSSPWQDNIPASFDWREKNAVTNVKDQDPCGNCWAFSAVANIEGQNAIKNGELMSFSEQQLTDCDNMDGHCNDGGWPSQAYEAIMQMGGLVTENDYPYVAKTQPCLLRNTENYSVRLSGYHNLTSDETKLAQWLAENGPVSIALNAEPFNHYNGGIISNEKCLGGIHIDHAVTLVGYGTENGMPYWIIKNSWGPYWGENGYVRMIRGKNMCGLAEIATSAIVV